MGVKNNFLYALITALAFAILPACNILYPTTTQEKYESAEPGTFVVHRVKAGESVDVIAKMYTVSIDAIQKINRKDVRKIVEGDFIRIPSTKVMDSGEVKDTSIVKDPDAVTPGVSSNEFSMALLLPFYLDKNFGEDQYNVHPSSMEALQFYEGAQMAAEDLQKDSIILTIRGFDSSNKNKVRTLLAKPEVASKDILIGEFSNSVLAEALPIVKNNDQNLILLKAFRSTLLEQYPQVALAKPSSANQCRLMAEFIQEKYRFSDMHIAFQDVKREKDLAAIFNEALDSAQLFSHAEMSGTENLMESSDEEIEKLFDKMDSTKHNVIFITSSNEPFVNSFLRRLYTKSKWDITIVGLPTWKNFNSINTDILNHFNLHIFTTDYIDYKDRKINRFRKAYIAEYNTDPLYEAYEGYFLVQYVANLYSTFGNKYLDFIADRPEKHFSFEEISEGGGLENSRISVLSYKNYQFKKVN